MHIVCGIKNMKSVNFVRRCAVFMINVVNECNIGQLRRKIAFYFYEQTFVFKQEASSRTQSK